MVELQNALAGMNNDLRQAQMELRAERARYFDLYDLAPVGYITVSESGLVLEANHAASSLLGMAREHWPASRFPARSSGTTSAPTTICASRPLRRGTSIL